MVQCLTFREGRRVEAQECRAARTTDKMTLRGKEFLVTLGTAISHSTSLHGDLTDDSYYSYRVLQLPRDKKLEVRPLRQCTRLLC